jgi:hypothetical protein
MLELLWVTDPEEAQSEQIRPTRLWERWSRHTEGSCPFGLCLRSVSNGKVGSLPFSSWDYRPHLPLSLYW